MEDWKWLIAFATPLILAMLTYFYKLSTRLTILEKKEDTSILQRLVKLETDTGFALKIIWEFLIAKVHNDNDEYELDNLLDLWKIGKLKKAEDIESLITGLCNIAEIEPDKSKRAAAELLVKMLEKGVGVVSRM